MSANGKTALAIACWAGLVCASFWQYDASYLLPVSRPAGAALPQQQQNKLAPAAFLKGVSGTAALQLGRQPILLNFWNPNCICSQLNEPVVRSLVKTYAPDGVQFVTIVECSSGESHSALLAWNARRMPHMAVVLDPGGKIARQMGVWATPGAVLLNAQGRVAYTGGYNIARFCHALSTSWVAIALRALVQHKPIPHPVTPYYGCRIP